LLNEEISYEIQCFALTNKTFCLSLPELTFKPSLQHCLVFFILIISKTMIIIFYVTLPIHSHGLIIDKVT